MDICLCIFLCTEKQMQRQWRRVLNLPYQYNGACGITCLSLWEHPRVASLAPAGQFTFRCSERGGEGKIVLTIPSQSKIGSKVPIFASFPKGGTKGGSISQNNLLTVTTYYGVLCQRARGRISSLMTVYRVSSSSSVVSLQMETRKVPSMASGATFMASSTWLRCPLAQALPADTQMP